MNQEQEEAKSRPLLLKVICIVTFLSLTFLLSTGIDREPNGSTRSAAVEAD